MDDLKKWNIENIAIIEIEGRQVNQVFAFSSPKGVGTLLY